MSTVGLNLKLKTWSQREIKAEAEAYKIAEKGA